VRRSGGSTRTEVVALNKKHSNALKGQVPEGGKPIDTTTNNQDFGLKILAHVGEAL
jgi:hypothetical protein